MLDRPVLALHIEAPIRSKLESIGEKAEHALKQSLWGEIIIFGLRLDYCNSLTNSCFRPCSGVIRS